MDCWRKIVKDEGAKALFKVRKRFIFTTKKVMKINECKKNLDNPLI